MLTWVPLLLAAAEAVTPSLTVDFGAVNEVTVRRGGARLAVYAGKGAERVLYTHARRDAFRPVAGAESFVPVGEEGYFREPMKFWAAFEQERFHDYEARASKWPVTPLAGGVTAVRGGEKVTWRGLEFDVVDTPGFTAGAVSYVATIDGKRIAFVGDLIYGDGQLLDIYSLQTGVEETKTRGYHGYGARAGELIASLRRIVALKPDLLVPARGPVVRDPVAAMEKLIGRLHSFFWGHFEIDALRWYWGDDNWRIRAGKILGDLKGLSPMAMSEQRKLPDWVTPIQNSRLIHSASGAAFLIDCGNARILAEVQKRAPKVEGIFITHYHDDHTDHAQAAANALGAKVYASPELGDILRNPRAYRMPAGTANAITSLQAVPEGKQVRWHEFEFTYLFFPGQTLYHGGLLVKKDGGETLFFVGDSFTPSGLDEYCLQNRNLLDDDQGYLYCLRKLREFGQQPWLINQHVEPMFRFNAEEMGRMEHTQRKRRALLAELTPFPHPNFAVDEQWAWFEPYEARGKAGATLTLPLRITNHAARTEVYRVNGTPVQLKARETKVVPVRVKVPRYAGKLWVATADVEVAGVKLARWAEAMVLVER